MKPILRTAALLAATALHAAAGAAPLQVTAPFGYNSYGASLSHDGSRLVFFSSSDNTGQNADHSYEVHLYERATGTLTQITNDARGIQAGSQLPSISGDGSRVVFQSYETRGTTGFFKSLYYDVATQQTVALNDYSPQFQVTAISRDGRQIALNRDNDGLRVIDTTTGAAGPVLAFNPSSITMSGDARRIAVDGYNDGVRFIDVVTGAVTQISPSGSGLNQRPDISDDGRTIAFSSTFDPLGLNADHNQELFLYDVDSGRYRQVTKTTRGSNLAASLSADGTRVAFTSNSDILGDNADGNQEIFVYDLLDDAFQQVTRTAGSRFYSVDAAISGDGLTIAYTSSGDFAGNNPNALPQVFLDTLAPRQNDVPEPPTLLLAAAAMAASVAMGRSRRRQAAAPACTRTR